MLKNRQSKTKMRWLTWEYLLLYFVKSYLCSFCSRRREPWNTLVGLFEDFLKTFWRLSWNELKIIDLYRHIIDISKMILWPSRTSCWCFQTPTSDTADTRDSDVSLATILNLRDPPIWPYDTSKCSFDQAEFHGDGPRPLLPTTPTPGTPTSS